jgi:hypothetical protein
VKKLYYLSCNVSLKFNQISINVINSIKKNRFILFKFLIKFLNINFHKKFNLEKNLRIGYLNFYSIHFKYKNFRYENSISINNDLFFENTNLNFLNLVKIKYKNQLLKDLKFKKNLFFEKDFFFKFKSICKSKMRLDWSLFKFYLINYLKVSEPLHYNLNIKIKKNNIFLIFSERFKQNSRIIFFLSAGRIFRGKKKRTYLTGRFLTKTSLRLIVRFFFKNLKKKKYFRILFNISFNKTIKHFLIKSVLNSIKYFKFPVYSLKDLTAVSHSLGRKFKKLRRL